ncbi:MAG TPA: NAD(P)/FAD-dependent oxidoreductase [Acidimicrobiales bacterium]|nr:NAD(P)/FAD-dependent oxidoreductase [Acidimicrobiales bacterium]
MAESRRVDVIVIGAGVAGLYAVHLLRERGFSVRALEKGDGVGGTWYWNRYPGARCDVQSIEYSYSFDKDIQQEWVWTELMPAQPEIEAYLNFVADRLDLRRDIQLRTAVTALTYEEADATWLVETDGPDTYVARWVIAATGCLSAPLEPDIPGLSSFEGVTLYTNRYPKEGFDFTGLRVGVVGTGSSGVQSVPVIAEQADHLYVFQRSAAYTRPANNRPLRPGELDEVKADYENLRQRQRAAFAGLVSFGAVSFEGVAPPTRRILDTPREERLAVLEELGWTGPSAWADVMFDLEANRAGTELYGELVRREVQDPDVAESLIPHYPMGCKRQILDTGYFASFNRDNVTLVDLRRDPIVEVRPYGISTRDREISLDVLVMATGFDAMTGALNAIDIRGRGGRSLRDVWAAEGPVSYLGLQVAGFPNLFTVTGPGSPSVLTNMMVSIEQHVEWISDCLDHLRAHDRRSIEASPEAQEAWIDHAASLVSGLVRASDACNSWYVGANVPGKRRIHMPYIGGMPAYRQRCEEVVAAGYEGFVLT